MLAMRFWSLAALLTASTTGFRLHRGNISRQEVLEVSGACDESLVQRRRESGNSMCSCRRRDTGKSSTGLFECKGNAIITPGPSPSPPSRRRRSSSSPTRRRRSSTSGATCEKQWNDNACQGQFGKQECSTCGERIEWLKRNKKLSDADARDKVAGEFISKCGACAANPGNTKIGTEGYKLVFTDNFSGSGKVSSSKWESIHSKGKNGFGNNEQQFYTNREENARMSEGTLKISAKRESYGGKGYTSAKLQTRQQWKYGKFSIRARLLHGTATGTWPAIWMMPRSNNYGGWPNSGEIDIMEHVGYDKNKVHGTVHTKAYYHKINTQIGGSIQVDVKKWHTYTMEWRSDVILFAVDNKVYQIFKKKSDDYKKWPFNRSFYLIMNMAVGGDWGGSKGIDKDAFRDRGQILEVDWVKVWQK